MTQFTPIVYNEATERRLAVRLWTLHLEHVDGAALGRRVREENT